MKMRRTLFCSGINRGANSPKRHDRIRTDAAWEWKGALLGCRLVAMQAVLSTEVHSPRTENERFDPASAFGIRTSPATPVPRSAAIVPWKEQRRKNTPLILERLICCWR